MFSLAKVVVLLLDVQMFTVQPTEAELITSDESSGGEERKH